MGATSAIRASGVSVAASVPKAGEINVQSAPDGGSSAILRWRKNSELCRVSQSCSCNTGLPWASQTSTLPRLLHGEAAPRLGEGVLGETEGAARRSFIPGQPVWSVETSRSDPHPGFS